MRICKQCQEVMLEGFDIKVEWGGYGIKISDGTGIFAKRLEKPKVAICPKCGEISLYIENVDKMDKR
ncbi:MAG: nucleic acid-binding protein [Clostridiales bacterium]|nr:nucleic acid-binding protein [Clostridiales bacterium]